MPDASEEAVYSTILAPMVSRHKETMVWGPTSLDTHTHTPWTLPKLFTTWLQLQELEDSLSLLT